MRYRAMRNRDFYLEEWEKKQLEKDRYLCIEFQLPFRSVVIVKKRGRYYYKEWKPTESNLGRFTCLKKCDILIY